MITASLHHPPVSYIPPQTGTPGLLIHKAVFSSTDMHFNDHYLWHFFTFFILINVAEHLTFKPLTCSDLLTTLKNLLNHHIFLFSLCLPEIPCIFALDDLFQSTSHVLDSAIFVSTKLMADLYKNVHNHINWTIVLRMPQRAEMTSSEREEARRKDRERAAA